MSGYRVYYRIEGEPGIGHSLGPLRYNTVEDALAELYDLAKSEQVISITLMTPTVLTPAPIFKPGERYVPILDHSRVTTHLPRKRTFIVQGNP